MASKATLELFQTSKILGHFVNWGPSYGLIHIGTRLDIPLV